MQEVEKMRKKTEKARRKAAKKTRKDKNALEFTNSQYDWNKDSKKRKRKRKSKREIDQVPKASARLSTEARGVNRKRRVHRKGNQGLTKAAKNQIKSERRRRRRIK